MPHCTKCGKGQARLNQGDLCKECFEQSDEYENSAHGNFFSQDMQNSLSTMLNPRHIAPIGSSRLSFNSTNSMNPTYDNDHMNFSQSSRFSVPQASQQFATNDSNLSQTFQPTVDNTRTGGLGFDTNTPVSALTAGQMLALIQSQTKPLEAKVVGIDQKLDKEINGLKTRINVLENEVKEQKEKNDTLTQIVVEMQKSLNRVDSNDREKNMIINGLPEGDLIVNEVPLIDDADKVKETIQQSENRRRPVEC